MPFCGAGSSRWRRTAPRPATQLRRRPAAAAVLDGGLARERAVELDGVALDAEHLAADVAARVAAQERHERRDVVGVPEVEVGLGALDARDAVAVGAFGHARAGRGADGVDGDAVLPALLRHDLGERRDAGLGRAVVALPEVAEDAARARRADDVPGEPCSRQWLIAACVGA
jgi:hypothetical protein